MTNKANKNNVATPHDLHFLGHALSKLEIEFQAGRVWESCQPRVVYPLLMEEIQEKGMAVEER